MHSVPIVSATSAHVIHPSPYRAAVLGRRVKLPDATAALMAELCFGTVHREQATGLPSSVGKARS